MSRDRVFEICETMRAPVPLANEIEDLVRTYEKLRHPDALSPSHVLRQLHRDIKRSILPRVEALYNRSNDVYAHLYDFAKQTVETNQKVMRPVVEDAKTIETALKQTTDEITRIQDELEVSPDGSQKKQDLFEVLRLRSIDLELLIARLKRDAQQMDGWIARFEKLIVKLQGVCERLKVVNRTFTKAMFDLLLSSVGSKVILGLPVLVGLVTTLILDRATRVLEPVTDKVLPTGSHDIVLLVAFALQVIALTPATDAIAKKLCWRSFDHALHTIRSLAPEVHLLEPAVAEVEQEIAPLLIARTTHSESAL
jgi:hypothetical protein